ncbi:MAG: FAD-dependent oxidoreductase, partial [Clostridiales bacterium]|jgi:NADH-quinone oxidoreductase subunit F|nr:FAD-dependent oxidoreductase [Clostridiales bacterium]
MLIEPEGIFYTKVTPERAKKIIKSQILEGEIIKKYTFFDSNSQKHIPEISRIPFFAEQVQIALHNCGKIDFASIESYIAQDGYTAIAKALTCMTPKDVIEEMKKSGLRGRGGGGFPTGIKWEAGLNATGEQKYIVCNADEGDPGAFMDRSLLEGDPHTIIEGMMLGGYAIGADTGYVYVRAEYPIAVERLQIAIDQAREKGILGKNIFGSKFSFDLEIRIGAGAFVCGEETSLMASIEGERGEPKQKPPFPFERGLFANPTIINNVETFANAPSIINKGGDWFAGFGVGNSKGTKVFALAGDIVNTGIAEVPMGISLGDLIYKIGGGIPGGKSFKAAQIGGPSGGCLTKKDLNTPIEYDSLIALGAIIGSGGLVVMNEDTCMVDTARYFMDFTQDESCGKCVPCRIGTKRMLEILEKITEGEGEESDLATLSELSATIKETAMCALGQTAPNPILSTMENFGNEYEQHVLDKRCPAGICSAMFTSPCQNACPAGINIPGYIALIQEGRFLDAYNLIRRENPFPAVCGRICTRPCEAKCRREQRDESIAICDLKRFVADYALDRQAPYTTDIVYPKNNKKVAIIGAGPSGLTCGYYLARLGYEVDVFEEKPIAGGVLAYGIPEYRLPADVLEQEIQLIRKEGVNIRLNTEVGKDILFGELRDKYDAIYIATGTQLPNLAGIEGEDLQGVDHGLPFLANVALGNEKKVGRNVAVIGGGNTAVDTARTAVRLGAEKVTIIYRRSREDMPAEKREISECLEEGVELLPLVMPVRFIGDDKGVVSGVECLKMTLGKFDRGGRRKPEVVEGSEFIVEADMVIPAISQHAAFPFISQGDIDLTSWGSLLTDRSSLMTSLPGVFAGGDVARGADVAIRAIADGKKAAGAIDVYLGGSGKLNKGTEIEIPQGSIDDDPTENERFAIEIVDPDKRKQDFKEAVVGYRKWNAIAESSRCLRCDRK